MGKDLKGRELGVGISQRKDGYYVGRFMANTGKRKQKVFRKITECRKWLGEARYQDKHSNPNFPQDMTIDTWFDYWIDIKKKLVRPNTSRNYTERYYANIEPVIGKMIITEVPTIHYQQLMNKMADEGYRSSTIYQTRIALYNMLDYAYQNDVIRKKSMQFVG